jgi:hypothetical protein
MDQQPLTPEMEEVVTQVIYAEKLRVEGDHVAESEALDQLELLCDNLTLDELLVALRHVTVALQQKIRSH